MNDVRDVRVARAREARDRNGEAGALVKLDAHPELSASIASIAYVGDRTVWDKGVLRFILPR